MFNFYHQMNIFFILFFLQQIVFSFCKEKNEILA
jgi:hypothetical protein